MHLLYLDESGSSGDFGQKHFVLAGISLFERQGYWIANALDNLAQSIDPVETSLVEFHGSPIFGGKKVWRKYSKIQRYNIISEALSVLSNSHVSNRVFACVVNKEKISPNDPVEYAFEQISNRFDRYLSRLHTAGDSQRGVMIFDKSTYETDIQRLARDFRTIGHTWGVLRNLAEVPLFIDSKASRLTQLADLVAYSIFRKYEFGDDQFFSIIKDRFDKSGGAVHGLCEVA